MLDQCGREENVEASEVVTTYCLKNQQNKLIKYCNYYARDCKSITEKTKCLK
jgi:hypothetical protein